jgi:hypothetical protein
MESRSTKPSVRSGSLHALVGAVMAVMCLAFLAWLVFRNTSGAPGVPRISPQPAVDNVAGSGEAESKVIRVELESSAARLVRILVQDQQATPVAGAWLVVGKLRDGRWGNPSDAWGRTDESGVAVLGGVASEAKDGIHVGCDGYASAYVPASLLRPGDVVVRLSRGAELTVRAETRSGRAVAGAFVVASNRPFRFSSIRKSVEEQKPGAALPISVGLDGTRIALGKTGSDGHATLRGLQPGSYEYHVWHPDHVVVGAELGASLPTRGVVTLSRPWIALAKPVDARSMTWWTGESSVASLGMAQGSAARLQERLRAEYPGAVVSVAVLPNDPVGNGAPTFQVRCLGRSGWWNGDVAYRPYSKGMTPVPLAAPAEPDANVVEVELTFVDPSNRPWKPDAEHPFEIVPADTRNYLRDRIVPKLGESCFLPAGTYELSSLSDIARAALPTRAGGRRFSVEPGEKRALEIRLRRHLAPVTFRVDDSLGVTQEAGGIAIRMDTGGYSVKLFSGGMADHVFWIPGGVSSVSITPSGSGPLVSPISIENSSPREIHLKLER